MEDIVECTMYAIYPRKTSDYDDFLNFILLHSPYKGSETIIDNVTEYSSTIPINKCHIVERYIPKSKTYEYILKYYPSTLIRKMDLKVNAKCCNKFSIPSTSRETLHKFLTRSGYGKNFGYVRHENEFYFDTFSSVSSVVEEPITLTILRLKDEDEQPPDQRINWDVSVDEKYEGNLIFEPTQKDEESKDPDLSKQCKVYVVELCGYCRMVDLEQFSEEMYNFSKNFEPYIYFRKSAM